MNEKIGIVYDVTREVRENYRGSNNGAIKRVVQEIDDISSQINLISESILKAISKVDHGSDSKLALAELEVGLSLSSEGKVSLLGTGLGISGEASIVLKFKRVQQ